MISRRKVIALMSGSVMLLPAAAWAQAKDQGKSEVKSHRLALQMNFHKLQLLDAYGHLEAPRQNYLTLAESVRSLRKRFAWLPWTALHGTSEEPRSADEHEASRARAEIAATLKALPPDNAAALLLHAMEGYSYTEIAAIQGCTMSAARSRIARARAAFKEHYPA